MAIFLSEYLPILIYILLCILITLLIIICVKVIKAMNNVELLDTDVPKVGEISFSYVEVV